MSAIEINDDIEQLSNYITAIKMLAAVYNHGSSFTDDLMPGCSEMFLEHSILKLDALTDSLIPA